MRKLFALLLLLTVVFSATIADARGGRSSDDCAPGSTDPDCK